MELQVQLPEPIATLVRERAARDDESPSDMVSRAVILLLEQEQPGQEDAEWLREALAQVDALDKGEEVDFGQIVREGEGLIAGRLRR